MFMTPTQALSQDADFEKALQSPAAALGLIV